MRLSGAFAETVLGAGGGIVGAFIALFVSFYSFLFGALLLGLNIDSRVGGWVSMLFAIPAGSLLGTWLVDTNILQLHYTNQSRRILWGGISCDLPLVFGWLIWLMLPYDDNWFIYLTLIQSLFAFVGYRVAGRGKKGN